MELDIGNRLKHAWNAFNKNEKYEYHNIPGIGYSGNSRPDRSRLTKGNSKSLIAPIYNRIAIDVASIDIRHCRLDDSNRLYEFMNTGLDKCLSLEANIDQSARSFIQDIVISMFDEGVVAVVPIDTTLNPSKSNSYDIKTMRVGKITEWKPKHVRVELYNDNTGLKEELWVSKSSTAIIENPMYSVINEPSGIMQRLIRKLNLLDVIDEQSSSGKLDLIIQLPYIIKSEARKKQADGRRKEIEEQLRGSKYGIAYTDGTEKITQLNRPIENNLMAQIEFLTSMLYSQLGMTEALLNGSASEQEMLNYHNRTIEPIISAITDEMKRKFLTSTARSQMQSIDFFKDPFRLVPVNSIAEIADKFTRNEILTSNEIRQILGIKPADDPKADELRNKNLNQSKEELVTSRMLEPEV